ncbi:MAG: hypothetical protein UR83_C0056G0002 [Candidatus Moranbacteria bacterium GW2011_GWF2_35_54]|nr:MAG: hypothetical protein UR83_C0056G0002 [Candidatus Moranbacteria bacterium GW2011_GWF2_35_54]
MENETKIEGQDLVDYAVGRIQAGVLHDEIKKQLHAVGWSDDEIDSAYAIALAEMRKKFLAKNPPLWK